MIDSGLDVSPEGRGTTRAQDAQGTPTRSHVSPSGLVYEDQTFTMEEEEEEEGCARIASGRSGINALVYLQHLRQDTLTDCGVYSARKSLCTGVPCS